MRDVGKTKKSTLTKAGRKEGQREHTEGGRRKGKRERERHALRRITTLASPS